MYLSLLLLFWFDTIITMGLLAAKEAVHCGYDIHIHYMTSGTRSILNYQQSGH